MLTAADFSLSVVIPNYNDGRYITHCLESVLSQSVQPDEIIVIDDASTDDSVSIISKVIAHIPCARLVLNSANSGTNETMNRGLAMSRSRFVVFLSANDSIFAGMFEQARKSFMSHPTAGLWSGMIWLIDERDQPLRLYRSAVVALQDRYLPPDECRRLAARVGNWFAGTMVYRRETLMETGGFDGALKALSDLVVCLAISSRHGALFSPVAFCSTRVHDDSLRSRTLGDLSTFNAVLTHFERTAPSLAPQLFDAQLISRTKDRWRFSAAAIAPNNIAALLTQHSSSVGQIAARTIAPVARVTKSGSLALAYLILRPFDVIPTLWYRYILAMVLRLKNCTTPKP